MIDSIFNAFEGKNILVIGDMMIDAYLVGAVSRISPEAPVPIVDVSKRQYRLGGAANVAMNLLALRANPLLCSVVGDDDKGVLLQNLMHEQHLSTDYLVASSQRRTTLKYRIIGNKSQMLRIDEEDQYPLVEGENVALLAMVQQALQERKIDAIIFEDYDKGVLTQANIRTIVGWAQQRGIIVSVDPKKRNFNHYDGVTLFKPNLKELRDGVHSEETTFSLDALEQMMRHFAQVHNIPYLFTTLSEHGVACWDSHSATFMHYPAFLREISDVSGAGDTVISVVTLCLLAGLPISKAVQVANLSGGIVCEYAGVVPVSLSQLKKEIVENKILTQ